MTSRLSQFSIEVLIDLFRFKRNRAISFDVLLRQILFTGVEALGLCILLSILLGAVIIVEGHQFLSAVGQVEWIYKILIFALVRDLGPFIVCIIVLARSGTAMTTELGNMRVNKEIDALITMGINPISYLISPRVLGMVISLILLTSYFLITGVFGGFLISNLFQNISFTDFFSKLINTLSFADILIMLIKVLLSGFFISVISSFHGLSIARAYTEVPQRNIKAVGGSVVAVCVIHAFGSLLYLAFT